MPWPPVPRDWVGETVFIVAGGPSVAEVNVELLRGRKVIAINSSYKLVPWADVLFFGDRRWWGHNDVDVVRKFTGRIVTTLGGFHHGRVSCLRNSKPPSLPGRALPPLRLSADPKSVPMRRTSLAPAINLAVHLGAAPIVLLGADGKAGPDGRTHHHDPHPWTSVRNCWDIQRRCDLEPFAADLRERGIDVRNASPGSAWGDLWPIVRLEQCL